MEDLKRCGFYAACIGVPIWGMRFGATPLRRVAGAALVTATAAAFIGVIAFIDARGAMHKDFDYIVSTSPDNIVQEAALFGIFGAIVATAIEIVNNKV